MKKNNLLGGLALILLAVILVGSGLDILPDVPWFKVLCSIVFGAYAIKALWKRNFFFGVMSLCIVAWIWDEYLMIEEITPFPLLLAGALVGIGLSMIFGKNHKFVTIGTHEGNWEEGTMDGGCTESWQDGRHITLENSFNSVSKYVNSEAFSRADLENNFGSANIYFNNAIIANGEAEVNIESNFGEMNIYFPKTWRVKINQSSAFGSVKVYGNPNNDMDAPVVVITAEANFGEIKIYFE